MHTVARTSRLRIVFVPAILALLLIGVTALASLTMLRSPDGQMERCPFMGADTVCQMSPIEHLAALQSTLAATAPDSSAALLLATAAVLFFVFFRRSIHDLGRLLPFRRPASGPARGPLQEQLSSGILNTRAF